jgi:threonine aldolase
MTANDFIVLLDSKGITASAFGPQEVRFVFHLDVSEDMMTRLLEEINSLK